MSLAEIKKEAKILSGSDRRDLVAYLIHLEESSSPEFLSEITDKIDDRKNFVRWTDVRDSLGSDQ